LSRAVAYVGPREETRAPNQPRFSIERDIRAVGKIFEILAVRALSFLDQPIGVELVVDAVRTGAATKALLPERDEPSIVGAAALGAWTMSGAAVA
jgi:hypothetical protein